MKRLWTCVLFNHYQSHIVIWGVKLQNKLLTQFCALAMALLTSTTPALLLAEEIIIQQEEISFEKCLKVIATSQDKLSITPEISNVSDQKRIAVFTLIDGTLTILCDREKGNVTVSTNTN